jgi:hypothetical protein
MGRNLFVINSFIFSRHYSNSPSLRDDTLIKVSADKEAGADTEIIKINNPLDKNKEVVVYLNMDHLKKILNDNKGKPGIYMLTNKVTKDFYIGQSKNLYNRFLNYFNTAYLKRSKSIISRALIKYGYSSFSLTILEYCAKVDLTVREQYYFDNILFIILKK